MLNRQAISRRGTRLEEHIPRGHWQTTSLLGGIRCHGPVAYLVVDGSNNGEIFRYGAEQHLIRELNQGGGVLMDNFSSHKVPGAAEAITRV